MLTDDLLEYWDRVQDHALGEICNEYDVMIFVLITLFLIAVGSRSTATCFDNFILHPIFVGKDGKTFFLSGACQTAYTSTQNCFCVSNPTDPDESNSWYLLADSER